MQIGLPMAAGGIWFSAVYVVIGRIISGEGAHNLAALGLGHRFETAAYTIAQARIHAAVNPLLSRFTTGEFNSPTNYLRAPRARVEPYLRMVYASG